MIVFFNTLWRIIADLNKTRVIWRTLNPKAFQELKCFTHVGPIRKRYRETTQHESSDSDDAELDNDLSVEPFEHEEYAMGPGVNLMGLVFLKC